MIPRISGGFCPANRKWFCLREPLPQSIVAVLKRPQQQSLVRVQKCWFEHNISVLEPTGSGSASENRFYSLLWCLRNPPQRFLCWFSNLHCICSVPHSNQLKAVPSHRT